jgi:hypothetical protein
MEIIIYVGLRPFTFSLLLCFIFCMFRTNFLSINLLKTPQSVILLEVSSDSRLSWSVRSIENATNTHEYLIEI